MSCYGMSFELDFFFDDTPTFSQQKVMKSCFDDGLDNIMGSL